jgi:crossover junction endodeoxyribonuclease RuvC
MRVFAGADPGLDGAIAFYSPDERRVVVMIGMPVLSLAKGKGTRREISVQTLVSLIQSEVIGLGLVVSKIAIERVSSSPQMGVASAFHFGRGYGVLEGVVASLSWPILYVTPAKWKREMAVPANKDDARSRACQAMPADTTLWTPSRNVFNKEQAGGRAEAALLALYASQQESPAPIRSGIFVRRAS